jgi:hypothetical protein
MQQNESFSASQVTLVSSLAADEPGSCATQEHIVFDGSSLHVMSGEVGVMRPASLAGSSEAEPASSSGAAAPPPVLLHAEAAMQTAKTAAKHESEIRAAMARARSNACAAQTTAGFQRPELTKHRQSTTSRRQLG